MRRILRCCCLSVLQKLERNAAAVTNQPLELPQSQMSTKVNVFAKPAPCAKPASCAAEALSFAKLDAAKPAGKAMQPSKLPAGPLTTDKSGLLMLYAA